MDIWIFIAAAGSGYLAQFWQTSQNPKGADGDISNDDDDHSGSPSLTNSTFKCHYVASPKRKSAKRRSHQKRRVPKLSEDGDTMLGGCLSTNFHNPLLVDSESWGVLALHNGVIGEDACSCPRTSKQSERRYDAVHCCSMSGSNAPSRCPVETSFNAIWPQKCCDVGLDRNQTSSSLAGTCSDDCCCCMTKDYLDSCGLKKVHENGSIRCLKEKWECTMADKVQALSSNRTWITGDHDQFEDVCSVGASDAHIMQECKAKSMRKMRLHHENEISSSFTKRRRSLAYCRPITCSNTLIPAKLGKCCRQEITCSQKHISLAHRQPLCQHEEYSGILDVEAISSDYLASDGNSHSSSSKKTNSRVLNKINLPSLAGKQKLGASLERRSPLHCLPSQSFNRGGKEARGDALCGDDFWLKGNRNNLLKMLLFNFGVGVGMMFVIMSSKHGTQQIIGQLEEVIITLKDLESEIQGRKKFSLGFNNNGDIRGNISPNQSPSVLQKVFGLVEQLRISLVENYGSVLPMDCDCSQQARVRLEAELEAELERMEFDFNLKNTESRGQFSLANEDGLCGNTFQGELSMRQFLCDIDAHSSKIDGNNFSHKVIHHGNSAVPPVELAKRLYEVLETRQAEKIMELEAEIKRLDNGLQAKEQQFQAWKQRVHDLLQETARTNLSSLWKDFYVEAENTSTKDLYSSTNIEDAFVVGLEHPVLLFPNNEDILSNSLDNLPSTYPCISQAKTGCGSEASNKAYCEGWLQPLNKAQSGPSSQLQKGLLRDADKREVRNRSIRTIQPEVMDVSYGSVSSCSSNNAVIDILGSTSYSMTSMDTETKAQAHLNNQSKCDVEVETSNRQQEFFSVEWTRDSIPCPEIICPNRDSCAQDVIDIHDSGHGQCGGILDCYTSEDSCNSSDLDERLGRLLIERIVQKGRKGVLMVEAAKSVMASFDLDNTSMDIGIPSN